MNKHPNLRIDLLFHAFTYCIAPLLVFGVTWAIATWLLSDGRPQWGNAQFWAALITIGFLIQQANEPPSHRSRTGSASVPPLTRAHVALKIGFAAFYTLVLAPIFGLASKSFLTPSWLSIPLTALIIVLALSFYVWRYRTYCSSLTGPE